MNWLLAYVIGVWIAATSGVTYVTQHHTSIGVLIGACVFAALCAGTVTELYRVLNAKPA